MILLLLCGYVCMLFELFCKMLYDSGLMMCMFDWFECKGLIVCVCSE